MEQNPDHIPEEDVAGVPDGLDLILDADAMLSVFDAQRLRRVDALRVQFLTDACSGASATSPDLVERSLRLELAAGMRTTEHAAGMLIGRAHALVHRYPQLLAALEQGRVTTRHTEVFVSLVDATDPEVRARVVAPAIELALIEPVGAFRRKLSRLIEAAQATTLTERHEAALKQRRAVVEPDIDGMGWLHLYGPLVELRALHGRVTRIGKAILRGPHAKTKTTDAGLGATAEATAEAAEVADAALNAPDVALDAALDVALGAAPDAAPDVALDAAPDGRTLDQIRYDVIADLLIDGVVPQHPQAARGIRADVVVTVPALSLLDDEHAAPGEPARVEGVGPIPIERARELCGGSGDWMRVLTHPETGMVVSVGRDRYRPPKAIRRLVKWRAGRCLAPGCGMPADRCEIDHSIDWAEGGETSVTNLDPFCTGHHTVKHGTDWTIEHLDGGAIRWTSPLGRVYTEHPERRLPTFTINEPAPF